jgi:ankyrin repeat protein
MAVQSTIRSCRVNQLVRETRIAPLVRKPRILPWQDGWTSLVLAAACGHGEAVKVLLEARADVNAVAMVRSGGGSSGGSARWVGWVFS